ncbi:MAG: hypothetical protein QM774_14190 [Gordonia sp. (in: high G+C Gram-positive bacteria)]|uniref:hypothetical protein n=1 Tax=Gordonia sp. (in: high G+C Gram-positive bacteria) TaxID=84139 RepID=UPI0039E3B73A
MSDVFDESTDHTLDDLHDLHDPAALDGLDAAGADAYDDDAVALGDDVDTSPLGAGNKDEYADHWFEQAVNGTCVPASVAQIVAEYTGEDIHSEDAFVQYAVDHGLYPGDISGGMSMEAGVEMLDAAGVPATLETGSMDELDDMLEDGRGVMIAIDSGYWDPTQEAMDEASGTDAGADHCVVVTEIDEEAGVVYLSDTGHPEGNELAVPIDEFEEAWSESDFTMVVCDEPSPNLDYPTTDDHDVVLEPDHVPAPQAPVAPEEVVPHEVPDHAGPLDLVVRDLVDGPWAILPVVLDASVVSPSGR